jgi:type IV pilus assembly protein PilE
MSPSFRRRSHGFTMIEVVIVLAIVAILAAVAVPAYQDQMRASRRTEAREALMRIQTAQERWRSNNVSYTTVMGSAGLNVSASTANYTYAVSGASATGYTATATARAKQAGDTACASFGIQVAGAVTTLRRNAGDDDGTCWPK